MAALDEEHCRQDAARLDDGQIGPLLNQIEGWERVDGDAIARTFRFGNFHETIGFVNALAWIANREDHHPDLEVGYNRCRVRYSTHSAKGLSRNDFICAARINSLI